jgi:opacity protein-like surface antigen
VPQEAIMRKLLLAYVVFSFAATLRAQEAPKAELYGGYSFANVNLRGRRTNENGWNASMTVNLNRWFGLVTDFGGLYGGSTMATSVSICFPPCPPQIIRDTLRGEEHTFLFGPRFSWRRDKISPFAHVLMGGARLNSTTRITSVVPPGPPRSFSSSNFAFSLALGGGVDYKFGSRWAWRVQTDYLQWGFFNGTQDNFRVSTGLVFHFGE